MEQNRRVRVSFERLIDTSSPDRGTFDSEEEEEFLSAHLGSRKAKSRHKKEKERKRGEKKRKVV